MERPAGRSAARASAALLGSIVIGVLLLAGCGGSGPAPDPTPTLDASAPADGATGVAVGTDIVLTFSEAMNRASVEAALSVSPAVTCTFSWSPNDRVLTCDAQANLQASTEYSLTVADSAESQGGVTLGAPFVSAFTTGTTTLATCTFGTSTFDTCVFGP